MASWHSHATAASRNRSISLIRPDRPTRAQIAHQERHRRSSYTEYLRKRLLGEREYVVVDAVAKLE